MTTNNLAVFDFNSHDVRVLEINNQPWFVAKDVCDILGITKHRDAISRLDDDERGLAKLDTPGGKQDLTIVSVSGMYAIVLTSRKPEAKVFRKWIFEQLNNLHKNRDFFSFVNENPQYADTSGFVYLVATPNGWYKIGMSKHPYKRMSSLQVGTPLEITLIHRVFSFDCAALEKALHDYYQAYWLRGEWFNLPQSCVFEFPSVATELDKTLEQSSLPTN